MSSNDMELFFLSLLLLFVLFVSLSLHFLVYKRKSHGGASKLPLGTTGFPVLGETLEFLSTGRKGIPEKFTYDRMAKFSREVFKSSLFGESFAIFCGPQGNKFLYSNENKLVTSWWPSSINKIFPNSSETSVVDESKKMRKVLPSSLKPEALQRYVGIMDTIAQRHFKAAWENKEEVMVFPLAKRYTFWLACRLFLSVDDPEHVARFAEPFNAVASGIISMPINFPGTPFNRAIKAANVIRKELGAIIKQRKMDLAENRASAKQDVLSHMLLFTDDSGRFMNEIDVANKILALLIGGHDTASASITFIMKYLAELPDIYEQVLKEQTEIANSKAPGELLNWDDIQKMKYSWNVACEVMRLAPPLQGGFREAITDFTYSGFSIPKGWKLYWTAHSTHRNPEYFPEPEKFDPSRFEGNGPAPYTFVPFGGGPRMCPGKEYARLEILVFMYHVVRRFKWQKVLPNEKIIVDPMPVPAKGLPIHLQAHKA